MNKINVYFFSIMTVLLSGIFTACKDDDNDNNNAQSDIIGKWQIENVKDFENGRLTEYNYQEWVEDGGHPFIVFSETEKYHIDSEGDKVELSTYTYNATSKILSYGDGHDFFEFEVRTLTKNKLVICDTHFDNEGDYEEISYTRVE